MRNNSKEKKTYFWGGDTYYPAGTVWPTGHSMTEAFKITIELNCSTHFFMEINIFISPPELTWIIPEPHH